MKQEINTLNLRIIDRNEILSTPWLAVKRTSFTDGCRIATHTTIHSKPSVAIIVKKRRKNCFN